MSTAVEQANTFLARGDVRGAAITLKQAEQAGDALAARELAVWLLNGQLVRRDLAASRVMFERAAKLGDRRSAAITRAFIAGGVGGPADWALAIDLLRAVADEDAGAAEQLRLIEAMALGGDGSPSQSFEGRQLSPSPEVTLFPSLFSPDECAFLISVATPVMQPSVVVDPHTGRQVANPVRTSSAAGFPFIDENPAIHALNRRLAAVSGTDVRAGEPLQVLHYAPGEQYHEHTDALPGVTPSEQRLFTFLVYLNDEFEGGETYFPAIDLKVRGKPGDGLLFRNASDDSVADIRAVHAGLPVTSGAKLIASRWIRAAPLNLG